MEKSYAIAAKLIALWIGLVVFVVFLMMIYPILKNPQTDVTFACGNQFTPTFLGEKGHRGKMLFIHNCAQCHAKNMKDALTGPPLKGWQAFFSSEKEFYLYLQNPKIYGQKTKNKHLKKLIKEFEPTRCVPFPLLTEDDVFSIIQYIDAKYY